VDTVPGVATLFGLQPSWFVSEFGENRVVDAPKTTATVDESRQLVDLLNSKDQAGGTLLQQLHRDALRRFCFGYLGRIEEAEDAVQEIFLKVVQASTVPGHFRPWLYKVARNHCLKCAQRKNGRDGQIQQPSQIPEAMTGQLTRLVNNEVQARMAEAFAALSDDQREVLRLRYAENLSRGEIAEVLDVTESLVKSRLFEGLKKLREEAARLESR
jgi:RNA polymerase sigma-70 factor (ECF subfamily)